MHALVVNVSIQPGHREEAQAELENNVVPRVKEAPGVVAGYWASSPDGAHGTSMVIFESEATAKRAPTWLGTALGPISLPSTSSRCAK
jgi:quinol monooxygenase YgiN